MTSKETLLALLDSLTPEDITLMLSLLETRREEAREGQIGHNALLVFTYCLFTRVIIITSHIYFTTALVNIQYFF